MYIYTYDMYMYIIRKYNHIYIKKKKHGLPGVGNCVSMSQVYMSQLVGICAYLQQILERDDQNRIKSTITKPYLLQSSLGFFLVIYFARPPTGWLSNRPTRPVLKLVAEEHPAFSLFEQREDHGKILIITWDG